MLKILHKSRRLQWLLLPGTQSISTSTSEMLDSFLFPDPLEYLGPQLCRRRHQFLSSENEEAAIGFLHKHGFLFLLCMRVTYTTRKGVLAFQPVLQMTSLMATENLQAMQMPWDNLRFLPPDRTGLLRTRPTRCLRWLQQNVLKTPAERRTQGPPISNVTNTCPQAL